MLTAETKFRENLKRFLTAAAGTIAAVIAVNTQLPHPIPPAIVTWMTEVAIVIGVFGASPLGRLIWKDPPVTTEEIQKPLEDGAKPVSGG